MVLHPAPSVAQDCLLTHKEVPSGLRSINNFASEAQGVYHISFR
jgi:hypothetical protein